jgi:hypothetical protein
MNNCNATPTGNAMTDFLGFIISEKKKQILTASSKEARRLEIEIGMAKSKLKECE